MASVLASALAAVAPVAPVAAATDLAPITGPTSAASPVVIGCDRADDRVEVTADAVLDPTCTYSAGFDVTASDVTLDCRGARIASPPGAGGSGIEVSTPVDVDLHDVTVRNCTVEGFGNSIRVTRIGFRTLPAGGEFDHTTADIVLEGNHVGGSHGVGIFVDGYVTGVTVRGNVVQGAGSSGIYLDGGSRRNVLTDNDLIDNGHVENGPGGQPLDLGGTTVWFWGVGREGISLDGSSDNQVVGNRFSGNSAGGVFVYKNCGEYPDRPAYFERRDPSARNVIAGNSFDGGRYGVWVGSRMSENTLPMACTDPAYVDEPGRRVVLDRAPDNVVRDNRFDDVTYGVRVEDDRTTVAENTFTAATPDHHAVVIGTADRTEVLDHPTTGTVITGNVADIAGNDSPYRWVYGEADTTVAANLALGRPTGICQGPPLPGLPFIFTIAVAPARPDGSAPPAPDLTVPTWGALASCRAAPAEPVPAVDPAAAPAARPVTADPRYTG